ncbi:MAG: TIGR01212 family radical SAM protein [Oligoflexia bacterium]|nr:TIGR01212 family radical SAM protein [Oligoflexia bacterium]
MTGHVFLKDHLKKLFGERVQRIPLDPGFTCPNRRDGEGCIFCDRYGSAAPWIKPGMSIEAQLEKGADFALKRYNAKKFIAYFQAFTTTNADAGTLRQMYEKALLAKGVVGMAVSTRPDVLDDGIVELLKEFSEKTYLWIELGAQSMNKKSLEWMNRGHDPGVFAAAVKKIKQAGIEVIGHIIFGLPVEDENETLDSFRSFLDTGIDGYKIHALHIIRDTPLERLHKRDPFRLQTMDEYVGLVRKALRITPHGKVIHRLTGEAPADRLVAPLWVLEKEKVLRRILE